GQLAATSALVVLGTQADLKKMVGGRDEISMFLINFNLPETEPPPEFQADRPPPISDLVATMEMVERWRPAMLERARELTLIRQQYERAPKTPQGTSWAQVPMLAMFRSALSEQVFPGWSKATPLERWRAFREELTLRLVPAYAGA